MCIDNKLKTQKIGSFWSRLHSTSKANKEDVNQGTCLLVQCKLQNLHCQFLPGYMPARLYQNEIFALSSYQGTCLSFFSQNKIIFCQNTSVRTPSLDSDVSSTFGRVSVARSFYIRWTFDVIVESNLKLCEYARRKRYVRYLVDFLQFFQALR